MNKLLRIATHIYTRSGLTDIYIATSLNMHLHQLSGN